MPVVTIDKIIEATEFSVTRSSGAGGQHINKTNSAVIAKLDLLTLNISDSKKSILFKNLSYRLVQDRYLTVRCENQRDQKTNKDMAIERLSTLIESALYIPAKRIKTKPTKSSIKKRLETKSKNSNIKKLRREKF